MIGHRVTVWRLDSLPGSETFIRNQVEAFEHWRPTLLGSLRVDSPIARASDPVVFTRTFRDRVALTFAAAFGRSRRVYRTLRETRPDLVHAHFAKDAWMVLRACQRLEVPLVVTAHGYDVTALPRTHGMRGFIYRRRLRSVFRHASAVIAVSEFIRAEAIRCGAVADRTAVLPIGIPVSTAPIAAETIARAANARPIDVLFVGRLVEKKGLRDAFHAIAAQPNASALRCECIGDGPLKAEAEQLARQLQLNVTFTGALAPDQVTARFAAARVLLAPSQQASNGDCEGFGMVFLEAARAGVPAAAYAHGGVPEAVVHGHTGLLAREGDVQELAEHLGKLLHNEQLRLRMGTAAQHRAINDFDIRRCTADLEALFDDQVTKSLPRSWR